MMNKELTIAIAIVTAAMGYRFYRKRKIKQRRKLLLRSRPVPITPQPVIDIPPKVPQEIPITPILPPKPQEIPEYQAPLIAEVIAEVGAPMHNVISANLLKNEALKQVDRIRQQVENCPNAPKLQGIPQIAVRKSGGGLFSKASYFSTITWSGIWQDEFLYDNTTECVKNNVMGMFSGSEKYIKSINIRKGA